MKVRGRGKGERIWGPGERPNNEARGEKMPDEKTGCRCFAPKDHEVEAEKKVGGNYRDNE